LYQKYAKMHLQSGLPVSGRQAPVAELKQPMEVRVIPSTGVQSFCATWYRNVTCEIFIIIFLRATAVPAGTAEARISYGISVRLSVCHDPVVNQAQVR